MNLISYDVVIEHILPYLSHYDIFLYRSISKWWYSKYHTIQEEFLDTITMSDILRWNDPDILYEIQRERGKYDLFDIIAFRKHLLFNEHHKPLLDALLVYEPFIEYIKRILRDGDFEIPEDYRFIIAIAPHILRNPDIHILFGDDSEIWTSLLYGTYASAFKDIYESYQDIESMLTIIEEHSYTINAQRIVDDIEYTFGDILYDNPTWTSLKERIYKLGI